MGTQTTCDKCHVPAAVYQLTLGGEYKGELCGGCVAELQQWLMHKPQMERTATGKAVRHERLAQAHRHIRAVGVCHAKDVAAENGEPYRKAYHGLIAYSNLGSLVHLGGGVFKRPETAEGGE